MSTNNTGISWASRTWNPVPNYDGYFANEIGQVASFRSGAIKVLKPIARKPTGHLYVFLYRGLGRGKKVYVHHVVLAAFGRSRPEGAMCRHLDGNPSNNSIRNLTWGTAQENADDKQRHGTQRRGTDVPTHRLNESDVLEIRFLHGRFSLRAIAAQFGVSHTAIRRAALGAKWSHIKEGLPNG